ncbi:hypothetical protein ABZS83_06730 [Streptomyces sp. NPDC005426]|uniref:hypothetical protein n=1 Tax=Streptomyces sp. NPDC005426 TaxID=3155344 RepID=UPI0033BE0593
MAFRFWCGECGFKTPWMGESQGAQRQLDHYVKQHPGIPAGGHVETDRRSPEGGFGFLHMAGIGLLLLIVVVLFQR